MLVDGFPSYDYSSADFLPVDDISIAIAVLIGVRSRANRTVLFSTKEQFAEDVSKFERFLDEAVSALEELRFQGIKNKQISGGSNLCSGEDFPSNERSIAVALLNNAKIRAELSISNAWGSLCLTQDSKKQ